MADDKYWHFLGLEPGASEAEIMAARNRLAKLFHPDKGGTDEDMKRLNVAFDYVTGERKDDSNGNDASSATFYDIFRELNHAAQIARLQKEIRELRKLFDAAKDRELVTIAELARILWSWKGLKGHTLYEWAEEWINFIDRYDTVTGLKDVFTALQKIVCLANNQAEFVGKSSEPKPRSTIGPLTFQMCGKSFKAARSDAKTCSDRCRQILRRSRVTGRKQP